MWPSPVSHPVLVKNQLIQHPTAAGFFIASPLCLRSRKPVPSTAVPQRAALPGTGSPVPKSNPQIRALAPEVRFESFNLYAIAREHEGQLCLTHPQLTNQRSHYAKNQVSDPITDQEIAFAHLVLSATMTDRHAAEAAGLNPTPPPTPKPNPVSAPTCSSTGPPYANSSCSRRLSDYAG